MSEYTHSEYRVFGPPGTGKTTALAKNIFAAARKYGASKVVAVSFTRAAAAEIASRRTPLPKSSVGTLHSFAFRALNCPDIAESKLDEWNESDHCKHGLQLTETRSSVDDVYSETNFSNNLLNLWNKKRSIDLRNLDAVRARAIEGNDTLSSFARRYTAWKVERGLRDFTDLIVDCFLDVDRMPGDPHVGFFDEVQDFTPLELALVRKWGERMQYFVLSGDDDQCIYAFKGASPRAFLFPPIDDEHKIFLRQSYRVPRAVHAEASSRFTSKIAEREVKEYLPRDADGSVDKLEACAFNDNTIDMVVDDVEAQLERGKTCMILTSCGYMLGGPGAVQDGGRKTYGVIDELRKRGVAFHNPYRVSRGDWNPTRGGVRRLTNYLRFDARTWGDRARDWTYEELWSWLEFVDAKFLQHGTKKQVKQLATTESMSQTVTVAEVAALFRPGVQWWNGDPHTLRSLWLPGKQSRLDFALRVSDGSGRRALLEKPRVIVGTIHSVKGGESDVVYVAPDLSDRGNEEWKNLQTRDRLRRLFYVAVTRARERVVKLNSRTEHAVW